MFGLFHLILFWNASIFFQFIASYVCYSGEKLAGDLLFGLKFVKLSILPTLFIHFVWHSLGELRSRYLGIKRLNPVTRKILPVFRAVDKRAQNEICLSSES